MEDVHAGKKKKTQETKEEELETRVVEKRPDQPGFQVTLEDPSVTITDCCLILFRGIYFSSQNATVTW